MNREPHDCSRIWQAEAIEDGRLDGHERESFERHVVTCPRCAAEQRTLRTLRDFAERLPEERPGEFERRRLRLEILRQADTIVTGSGRPVGRRGYALAAVAGLILALTGIGWSAIRDGHSPHDVAAGRASVDGVTQPSGCSFAQVADASRGGRAVPGGAEGSSSVSAHDRDITQAPAGVRQARPADAPASALVDGAPQPAPSTGTASAALVSPRSAEQKRVSAQNRPGSKALVQSGSPQPNETAGQAFTRAIAAFSHGDYAGAEARFRQFESKYSKDARAEDAAFLRAICHQRRGDADGAAREASEYLRRYPEGFRRREANTLLVGY